MTDVVGVMVGVGHMETVAEADSMSTRPMESMAAAVAVFVVLSESGVEQV